MPLPISLSPYCFAAFLSHNLFHLLEPSPSFSQDYWEFSSVAVVITNSLSAITTLGRKQVEEEGKMRCQLVKEVKDSNGDLEEEEEEEEEVWPVEHPVEPMDEDRPVICPIPTSFLLPQEGRSRDQKKKVESWRKRAENPVLAIATTPIMINNNNNNMDRLEAAEGDQSIGVIRKRYHTHINQKVYRDDYLRNHHPIREDGLRRMTTLPPPSNNNVADTIFHMLQRAP
ncbi:unnamed protein product [Linum trigynum]|uniref:Uncharacterized protein n=1 Tax=Linum trigynum TaxID=586398 RepID=A0AAV2GE45_9ROSI